MTTKTKPRLEAETATYCTEAMQRLGNLEAAWDKVEETGTRSLAVQNNLRLAKEALRKAILLLGGA